MPEAKPIVAAVCDGCSAAGPMDPDSIRAVLARDGTISRVVILERPCVHMDAPWGSAAAELAGCRAVVGACRRLSEDPRLEDAARQAGLAPHEYVIIPAKERVYDAYQDRTAMEEALAAQLLAAATRLEAREPQAGAEPLPRRGAGVLVYGSGLSGLRAAIEVAGTGAAVDIVETSPAKGPACVPPGALAESLDDPGLLPHLSDQVRRTRRIGFLPTSDFQGGENLPPYLTPTESGFRISGPGHRPREYGAVVFAPDTVEQTPPVVGAWNLTQLYDHLRSGESVKGRLVFVLDHDREGTAPEFRDVLAATRHLKERRAEVWVLLRNARVGLPALQELYDRCRDAGAVFLKYQDLDIQSDYGDITITGRDEQTGARFSLVKPERVVIPCQARLDARAQAVAAGLGMHLLDSRYGQPDSLWRSPNQTNRPGIFVCGCAQADMDAAGIAVSAASLASRVCAYLGVDGHPVLDHIAVVDADKCAFCLTCVRVCPFGAAVPDVAHGAATVLVAACQACGTCAAECPAGAIQVRNLPEAALDSSIAHLMCLGAPGPERRAEGR